MKNKSIIVLTARVHPGETPSSWIMRGILHFITGSSEFANELRQKFIFKVSDLIFYNMKSNLCILHLSLVKSYFIVVKLLDCTNAEPRWMYCWQYSVLTSSKGSKSTVQVRHQRSISSRFSRENFDTTPHGRRFCGILL